MATKEPITIATSICSMLKLVKEVKTGDIMNSLNQYTRVVNLLPEYYSSLDFEPNPKIKTKTIIYPKPITQRYLLVLSQICKVLGTCIYTKEILDGDNTMPKYALILTSYQPEFIIVSHIINHIDHFIKGMKKYHKLFEGNKTKVRAKRERDFLNGIYKEFLKAEKFTLHEKPKKRFKKVLHSVIKLYKFEYQNINDNPQYGGKIKLKTLITKKGKWKNHKLLWD